jgi:L-fuconolactonase
MEDLRDTMDRFGVAQAVLVQHLGEYDNHYIEKVVRDEPDRFTGVMLIDVNQDDAVERLGQWAEGGAFSGIRMVGDTYRTHPRVWREAVSRNLNIIVYAEPTMASVADLLLDFIAECPEARIVLSHLGMPDEGEAPDFKSSDRILALASSPNVYVQVSGMHMFTSRPYESLKGLVSRLSSSFGPQRLIYGSNYPVMETDEVYGEEIRLLAEGELGLTVEEAQTVMRQTSASLWFGR